MQICRIFTLRADIKNPLREFEDIHQQIRRFMKIRPYGEESILFQGQGVTELKIQSTPQGIAGFRETLEGISASDFFKFAQEILYICCQSKDMADFRDLQGKL